MTKEPVKEKTMCVWLTAELLDQVNKTVEAERYPSRSWLVREAVYLYLKNLEEIKSFQAGALS
jgi:Arc/MetJ-type ribon-helix-helix transcriptional regulator